MPSQKQVQWSQLKVGLTVVIASLTLGVLIFLMSGSGGWFTKKITLKSYFDNASGLRQGAPVRLNGVDIGNVETMRVVSDKDKQLTPVEVVMKVSTKYHDSLRQDSLTSLSTAGVLGETYVDINSSQAVGPEAKDGDVLPIRDRPDLNDMIRSSQGTLQNMDALLRRLDRIVAFVESGKGSVGKLIYDPTLYNRITDTVNEFQAMANDISKGKGTVGKLLADDTLYTKLNATMDKVNLIVDDINAGKGTAGKFLKDPALFNNANAAIANLKQLTDEINAGKGTLGKLAKDQEMANKITDTVNKLQAIAAQINSGQGTIGKLLQDPSVFNNLDQVLVESRELVKSVRENPKKYLTIRLRVF
ncbi:MAG TPA: MlaD family protein [Terriglobales bacterium]|nr:MlaD family protein [Terriglobales bacterium]